MLGIIWKLLSLLGPVALGYFLKKIGFFGPKDYRILSKIAINVTLPCAVISSFAESDMDLSYLVLALIAFIANWVVLLFGYFSTRSMADRPKDRMTTMLCASGYNLGNFLIPFVQQFLGSAGVASVAIFDSGNSLMCTGGIYVFTTSMIRTSDSEKVTLWGIIKKLITSVPLVTYVVMIVLMLLGIAIPSPVATIVSTTGNANGFVSMFMIGLMFEIRFDSAYMKSAMAILWRKYLCSIVFAVVVYFLLPLPLATRQVLTLIAFAPIPSLGSIYTEQAKGDVGLASFATSLSFIISCCIIVALIMVMGLV